MTLAILLLLAIVAAVGIGLYVGAGDARPIVREPEPEPAEGYFGCFGCTLAANAGDGYLALHLRRDHVEGHRTQRVGERAA